MWTLFLSAVLLSGAGAAAADITREEALALAYPGAFVRAERIFLTDDQRQRASTKAGEPIPSALVARYIARVGAQLAGRAYVDTSIVRTKKETLLVSLDAEGRVKRVDVVAFLEPSEYRPPDAWLRQFQNRQLDDQLQMSKAIRSIAGATLTARAVNGAVRRMLAIDSILQSGDAR